VISSVAGILARGIAPLAVVALAGAGVLAEPIQSIPAPAIRLVEGSNPLAGKPFYVDPISSAMLAAKNAAPPIPELTTIANTPASFWLDEAFPAGRVSGTVSRFAGAAQAAGAMPVFTLYAIPHRDCYSYAAGGFGSAAGYTGWIDAVAGGPG
jgi:endoglucanase